MGTNPTQQRRLPATLTQTPAPVKQESTPDSLKIVETDASDIGYGGILKQKTSSESPEQIVRFHSGIWNPAQRTIVLLKKRFYQLYYALANSKMIY